MGSEPLFFTVVPREAVWGGPATRAYFGYDVPSSTGQVWAFSAQGGAESICRNGASAGWGLRRIWDERPELFASSKTSFPFIISLVAPSDNLSVQVHPGDAVARALGREHGKNEAWVMLEAAKGASIVYGFTCEADQAIRRIRARDMAGLFREVETPKGSFVSIPAGTVHGLGQGIVAYEVQQSTDITFRIYDYGRRDADGRSRRLDIDHAIESIRSADPTCNAPVTDACLPPRRQVTDAGVEITTYLENESFRIRSIRVRSSARIKKSGYWLCTAVRGRGRVNGSDVAFSDNFLVPATGGEVTVEGDLTIMITSEPHR